LLGDRKSDTARYERSTLCWRYDSADSIADRATPRQDEVVARKKWPPLHRSHVRPLASIVYAGQTSL
jgi:hypothetical protein